VIRFTVPVELAIMIFWFLASRQARLLALMGWWIARRVVREYYRLYDYLAGWKKDISLVRLALIRLVPDLLTIQVSGSFAFG
jgi:hypothetical protein